MTKCLLWFQQGKEDKKEFKRTYQRRLDVKAQRSKKQKKSIELVLKECIDNSYGPGIGLNAELNKTTRQHIQQHKKKTGK